MFFRRMLQNYLHTEIVVSQVALIVFLSHIGSFVPADAAVVGVTDRLVIAKFFHCHAFVCLFNYYMDTNFKPILIGYFVQWEASS